jgi:hypothetical protein
MGKTGCDRKGSELRIEQTGTQRPEECMLHIVVRQDHTTTYWAANRNLAISFAICRSEPSDLLRPHRDLERRIDKGQSYLDRLQELFIVVVIEIPRPNSLSSFRLEGRYGPRMNGNTSLGFTNFQYLPVPGH